MNSQSPRQPFKRSEAGAKGGRPRKETQEEKANGFSEDELKAKKANGFSEKQTKAKKADKEEDKEEDKDLLPNGNKKESKKESGSFDAILREYTGDEETLSLLGETDCPQCAFKGILRGYTGAFICFLKKDLPKTGIVLKRP